MSHRSTAIAWKQMVGANRYPPSTIK